MHTDEELYRRYLAADQNAAAELVSRYGDNLTLYLNGYLKDINEAEDLMIEAFARLFARTRPIDGSGSFRAYLYKIARNLAIRHRQKRRLLVLGFGYACFAMGTGYYLLHMLITGDVPRIFYVAEICWISTYLFFLSQQILRLEGRKLEFSWPALLISLIYGVPQTHYLFMPSYILSAVFALILMAIVYLSVFRRKKKLPGKALDLALLLTVALQECVYIISAYTGDYTRFNLYFAADMLLTLAFAGLLPLTLREEKR